MEITFKDLNKDYIKGPRELVGDIQPKFWYTGRQSGVGSVLVKRQSSERGGKNKPRSPMYNHIGEYFGYVLAERAGVKACPVDLVTLHDYKNKYSSTIKFFTACASHNIKKLGTSLIPGEVVISRLNFDDTIQLDSLMKRIAKRDGIYGDSGYTSISEDNVDLVIASIARETLETENRLGKKTSEEIKEDTIRNVQDAINMIVFDCIFGNHDRHSGNWSMEIDTEAGSSSLYSAYDNEAVLGLRRSVQQIESVLLNEKTMEQRTDEILFSRMNIGRRLIRPTYREMLEHLVQNYPDFTYPAISRIVTGVDEKFLESLYEDVKGISQRGDSAGELTLADELPEVYKDFGLEAFKARRKYALELLRTKPFKTNSQKESAIGKITGDDSDENNKDLELV